jgi:aminoglycoside phosphotransferase (APT) family kinase protein
MAAAESFVATDAAELTEALRSMGLLAAEAVARFTPLSGGVSSEIWRVDLPSGPICVKRALAKLRTERDWFAPIARWRYEYEWLAVAAGIVPQAVPRLLGADPARGLFAMAYLDPQQFGVWKAALRNGCAEPQIATAVGRNLAAIHTATARRTDVASRFRSDEIFYAIRLDPYLGEVGRRHPDLAAATAELVATTAATHLALVHGDVSPKNILVGPDGPVFLDAECAWYGDPAFDLAFCLNHLLLKCVWRPVAAAEFLRCFDVLRDAYLAGVRWEVPEALEARAARLLPGLLLARIDGKSPVEYITAEAEKERIRRLARFLVLSSPLRLGDIRAAWTRAWRFEGHLP